MTTKQERIKIIKMLEKVNGLPLVRFDDHHTSYESIIYDEDERFWSVTHFVYRFMIIDDPYEKNIFYIASDITDKIGSLIIDEGLDYAPLDDNFWWEEHRHEIFEDNLALPELFICGEGCISEYEKVKKEYMKKSSLELKKVPEGLRGVLADWIYTFFAQFKVMAYRAEYVSKKRGIDICIGSIGTVSTLATRYYFFVKADASDLDDVREKFRVAVYAADPYNAYDDMHGRWYLNKPGFADPFGIWKSLLGLFVSLI